MKGKSFDVETFQMIALVNLKSMEVESGLILEAATPLRMLNQRGAIRTILHQD